LCTKEREKNEGVASPPEGPAAQCPRNSEIGCPSKIPALPVGFR